MRYLVFAGDVYYPGGGWNDFRGAYDDLEDAREALLKMNWGWSHIVDISTGEIVFEYTNPHGS